MQFFLTTVIIIGAVAYAAWRFYDAVRDGGDPCKGCELKEKCQKNCKKTQHLTCHCK